MEDWDGKHDAVTEPTNSSTFSEMTDQGVFKVESDPDPLPSSEPAPSSYEHAPVEPQEPNQEEINLFEECSQPELVDPNDLGPETRREISAGDTVRETGYATVEDKRVGQNATGSDLPTRGVLGAFLTLSKTKKATKRRFAQPKKDPDQPVILILDSLGQTRSGAVRALKDWLSAEGKAKRGMEAVITENGYYPKCSQIPTQDNWSDCGVYLLGYAEKFFQDPDQFKYRLLAGEMSAKTDWPELEPKQMRTSMRNVIIECAKEKKITRVRGKQAKMMTTPASTNDNRPLKSASPDLSLTSPRDSSLRRLASPFMSPKPSSIMPGGTSSAGEPRSNDVVSPARSLTRSSSERLGPDVRIPRPAGKSHNARAVKAEVLPRTQRPLPELLRLATREQQHNMEYHPPAMGASARKPAMSPQQQAVRPLVRRSPSDQNHREGSVPDVPIEIPGSQQELSQRKASPRKSPAKPSPTKQSRAGSSSYVQELQAAVSLEAMPSSYCRDNATNHRREAYSRSESPMLMDRMALLDRAEEAQSWLMDLGSPAADAMDIDSSLRGGVVNETPEPNDGHFTSMEQEEGG